MSRSCYHRVYADTQEEFQDALQDTLRGQFIACFEGSVAKEERMYNDMEARCQQECQEVLERVLKELCIHRCVHRDCY